MGRSGRLPGPLKGRTAEANALAQFLRDLTAQDTVSQLEQRYKLSRSVWSEYRSGMKTIPLPRLNRIIEDRFPRDARTRSAKLQEARRLHAAAVAAPLPPPPHTTPTPDTTPAPVPAPGGRSPDHDQAPEPMPEPVSEPAPIVRDDTAGLSADNPVTSENAAPKRTERPGRWRAPAQWAALAALVAALILANQMQGSNDRPSAASPLNVPEQGLQSAMPATPTTSPTGPMAPVEERPAPPQSSAPAEPAKRAPEKSRPRAGGAGIVAATTDRLYRITADAQVEEYTGKAGVWTVIRKRTERIFTSATTLYATDIGTGDIEEYDRTKKTWTVIGGPGLHFAATSAHLYGVGTLGTMEYSGTPKVWHHVRGATERIFTNATTLYATDAKTGDIEEYDRTKKTWTVIGGPGLHFAATSTHLYGVGTLGTMEYSGTPKVWHHVRGATERIFTNATTLYATDAKTGDIEEYDRTKKTWTVIGDPVSSFAATKKHLYRVSADLSSVDEYAGRPGTWSPIGSP